MLASLLALFVLGLAFIFLLSSYFEKQQETACKQQYGVQAVSGRTTGTCVMQDGTARYLR